MNSYLTKLLIFLLFVPTFLYSQQEVWSIRMESGDIAVSEGLAIEDDKFDDIVNNTATFEDLGARIRVLLGVDERADEDYTALGYFITLELDVIPYNSSNVAQTAIPIELRVGYNSGSITVNTYADLDVYELTGYHKAEIEITGITITDLDNVPQIWAVPVNVYLELRFETDRYYELDMAIPSRGHHLIGYNGTEDYIISSSSTTTSATTDIEVFWSYVEGAREYELEWCWVDNYGANNTTKATSAITLSERDFERFHTRIRTTDQHYRIPVVYGKGYLVYRVRGVGRWMNAKERQKYGAWTSGTSTKTTVANWPNRITIAHEHESKKNWQYQSTYAEGGKKKEVVSYFDGSLRNRQTVTRMNTQHEAIVGESIYDNQGRAAIQVLPAPVGSPVIGYYGDLNRNTSNDLYTHYDFDWEDDESLVCGAGAEGMSNSSGASKYYSSNNATQHNWQDRVPDAELYPFSQVEYTPDNTGRIRRQSGVGPTHKLGSGHETQYFYLQPTQEELNRLFGYKVGHQIRYKKNMVVDANGQVSVSYLDPQGRVIATAISGGSPDMFTSLDDEQSTDLHRIAYADLINKLDPDDTDTPIDNNKLFSSGRFGTLNDVLKVSTELGVSQANSQYDFSYRLRAGSYTDSCLDSLGYCYPYVYDLEITLQDDCATEYLVDGSVQQVLGGEHLDYTACEELDYDVEKEAILQTGSYSLNKVLKINEEAYLEYLEHYLANACLYTPDDFLEEVDTTSCFSSCAECLATLGEEETFVTEYLDGYDLVNMTTEEIDSVTILAEQIYLSAVKECNAPCVTITACESLRKTMEADVSPLGQYGGLTPTNPLSVFNPSNALFTYSNIAGNTNWKHPIPFYQDENGNPDYIEVVWDVILQTYLPENTATIPTGNPQSFLILPQELVDVNDFISYWKMSWATSLVPYHPEYCYLAYYDTLCSKAYNGVGTLIFNEELQANIDTYAKATNATTNLFNANLLTTGNTSGGWGIAEADPFYQLDLQSANTYMTHTWKRNLINAALSDYKGFGKTMLEVATEIAVCGTNFSNNCTPGALSSLPQSLQDRTWNIYKNLYLSFRTDMVSVFADIHARKEGCFSGCIGESSYEFFWTFNDYGGTYTAALVSEFTTGSASPQLCFNSGFGNGLGLFDLIFPSTLYSAKQARIIRGDALYDNDEDLSDTFDKMMNDAAYNIWTSTGICPLAFDLTYLLNGLAAQDHFSSPTTPINTNNLPEFTIGLYASMGGLNPSASDILISSTILSATTLEIEVKDFMGTLNDCPIVLESPSSSYNWNNHGTGWNIVSFETAYYIPGSYNSGTGTYNFKVVAWVGSSTGPMQQVVFTGSICAAIGECGVNVDPPHQNFDPNTDIGTNCTETAQLNDFYLHFEGLLNNMIWYQTEYEEPIPNGYLPDELIQVATFLNTSHRTDPIGIYDVAVTGEVGDTYVVFHLFEGEPHHTDRCRVKLHTWDSWEYSTDAPVTFFGMNFPSYSPGYNMGTIYLKVASGDTIEFSIEVECMELPIECPCIPQTVEPVSCTDAWDAYQTAVAAITDYTIPTYMNVDYFCHMKLQYISEAYATYLEELGITSTEDDHYLSIGEFGDTPQGYGHQYMDTIVKTYAAYLDTATTNILNWQEYGQYIAYTLANLDTPICPPAPMYVEFPDTLIPYNCFEFIENVAQVNANNQYDIYLQSVIDAFREAYVNGAIQSAIENFHMEYPDKEYHYTLYYYDQAGNLVQTVPPQGVDRLSENGGTPLDINDLKTLNNAINAKRSTQPLADDATYAPEHTLNTQYKYNSLNQLVWQLTPDGGESRFAYDALGRMVASQNEKQRTAYLSDNKERFSYTRYDALGRVAEVGEMTVPSGDYEITSWGKLKQVSSGQTTIADAWFYPGNIATDRYEVTRTFYNEFPPAYQTIFTNYQASHARNRISLVIYQDDYNPALTTYNSALGYDYDVHGNVKEILSINLDADLLTFGTSANQQIIKRVQYEYDLVSGNVNQVIYQAGETDQFMHRYQYDSDNRITEVETSRDGKIWENDASYFYYNHGPLARTEIGDKKVQGIDYAYTIQGWIKGVNSEELAPEFDMAHDGGTTSSLPTHINSQVAQDAFGYSLSYFEDDYKSRISGKDNFLRYSKNLSSSSANLYNGNIRDMYTAIMKDDETPLGTYNYQYQYDQLNRIKAMNSQGLSLSGSTIVPVAGLYETSYAYDRNGNITSLQRWADKTSSKTAMDNFTYDYIAGTNKLALVHDAVASGNFDDDLDDQVAGLSALSFPTYDLQDEATHNYRYDAIGQLVQDKTEEIDTIIWTVTGKVKKIQRFAFSEKPDLEFEYNPMGQRIMKIVYPKSAPGVIDTDGIEKMYYIRDAQGNVMAIYTLKIEDSEKNLYLTERNLYGSSMLGIEKIREVIASTEPTNIYVNTAQQRIVGDKRFYMQNHLGNVLATVTDRKLPEFDSGEGLAYYKPDVTQYSDFLPFGMMTPNRHGGESGRYGLMGMEKDDEIYGEGNAIDFGARMYDPRLGRWMSRDPLEVLQPDQSPYKAFLNNPIIYVDPEGETEYLKIVYKDESTGESMTLKVALSPDLDPSHLWSDGFVRYHDYSTTLTITKGKDGNINSSYSSAREWEYGGNSPRVKLLFGIGGVTLAKAMLSDQPGGYYMTSKNGMGTVFKSKNNPKYIGNIDDIVTAFGALQKLGTIKDVATGKKHGLDALDELIFEQILDAFLPIVVEEAQELIKNDSGQGSAGTGNTETGVGDTPNMGEGNEVQPDSITVKEKAVWHNNQGRHEQEVEKKIPNPNKSKSQPRY